MNRLSMIHLVFLLTAFGNLTYAQEDSLSKLDLSLGYSYMHVSASSANGLGSQSLNGADVSASYQVRSWLRAVADFGLTSSGYRSSDIAGISLRNTQSTYLFGPRVVFPTGRVTSFAQILFGVAHTNAGAFDTNGSQTVFAWALGGGIDFRFSHHLALRPIQLDYLRTNFSELQSGSQVQNDFRASDWTGVRFLASTRGERGLCPIREVLAKLGRPFAPLRTSGAAPYLGSRNETVM